ncbi:MAG: DUF2752 domain-containing protein [Selenomonadaceae bacterium]|jgi:hypothetical protein|nr:DUF2752 domain-containing protein [Selenomonadaceae bacterium]
MASGSSNVPDGFGDTLRTLWHYYRRAIQLGGAYAAFVLITGYSLPCPIHYLTGYLCPGCGITTICLALLQGDFATAWQANPALTAMLPLLCYLLYTQPLPQSRAARRCQERLAAFMVVVLVLYDIYRNIA